MNNCKSEEYKKDLAGIKKLRKEGIVIETVFVFGLRYG